MRRFEIVPPKNAADGKTAEVYLYDVIGKWFDGVSAKAFIGEVNAKAENAETLVVNLNSPGGDAFDGDAIYNFLVRHKAKVVVNIDGLAASAAATVAMAGDEIRIAENGLMMIHNSAGLAIGSKADMRKLADTLEKLDATIRDTYAARTGQDKEQVEAWMDEETWFSADDAVAHGFATSVNTAKRAAALAGLSATNLDKLPCRNRDKLAALTVSAADTRQPGGQSPPANAQGKESDMSDKTKQAGQGGDGAAPANSADGSSAPPAKGNDDPGQKFLDAFGDQGGVWFAQGKTFDEARDLYGQNLQATNKALTEKVADLEKRLEAANKAAGSNEPASFDGTDGNDKDAKPLAKLTAAFNGDEARARAVLAERAKRAAR